MRRQITKNRALVPLLSLAAIALFPGCGQNGITDFGQETDPGQEREFTPRPTFDLVVLPANPSLEVGETLRLEAFLKNSHTGHLTPAGPIRWESESLKRATVSEDGLVEAHGAGEAFIIAIRGEYQGEKFLPFSEAEARVLVK